MGALSHAKLAPQSARRLPGSVIVADGDATAWFLAGVLRHAGFPVVLAGSGETALEMITTARVDLMVTNLHMPDMRGDVLYYLALAVQPHLRAGTEFFGSYAPSI